MGEQQGIEETMSIKNQIKIIINKDPRQPIGEQVDNRCNQ